MTKSVGDVYLSWLETERSIKHPENYVMKDDDWKAFEAFIELKHPNHGPLLRKALELDAGKVDKMLRPLFEQWCKECHDGESPCDGANSTDGEYEAFCFRKWVKQRDPEIYELICYYDDTVGFCDGDSFVATACSYECHNESD